MADPKLTASQRHANRQQMVMRDRARRKQQQQVRKAAATRPGQASKQAPRKARHAASSRELVYAALHDAESGQTTWQYAFANQDEVGRLRGHRHLYQVMLPPDCAEVRADLQLLTCLTRTTQQ